MTTGTLQSAWRAVAAAARHTIDKLRDRRSFQRRDRQSARGQVVQEDAALVRVARKRPDRHLRQLVLLQRLQPAAPTRRRRAAAAAAAAAPSAPEATASG